MFESGIPVPAIETQFSLGTHVPREIQPIHQQEEEAMHSLDRTAYIARMFDNNGKRHEYRITGSSYAEGAARKAFDLFLSDTGYGEMFNDGDEKIIAVCDEHNGFTAEDTEWFMMSAESTIVHNTDELFDIEDETDIDPHKWMYEDQGES